MYPAKKLVSVVPRALLLAIALGGVLPCFAQSFGNWAGGVADDGTPYIYAVNDSEVLFGKWCDASDSSCFWIIASPTVSCDAGKEYAALASSDLGTLSVTLTCSSPKVIGAKQYWRLMLSNPDAFDNIAMKANNLGFAIAMANGEFRVLRFPMNGSDKALSDFARKAAAYFQGKKKPAESTKDTVL